MRAGKPVLFHHKGWRAFIVGASALALVCFCLLYIIFLTVPAQASTGNGSAAALVPLDTGTPIPTDTSTPSPTVTDTPSPTDTSTPSPTVTDTPSPTVTNTPSPTVTSTPSPTITNTVYPYPTNPTTTPAPSPTATHAVFPSPTTASTVGAKTSPTGAATPGASPTGGATPLATQGSSTNQGSGYNTGDSSNSGSNPLADALPLILGGLGVIVLLPLLFIPVRILLRRRMVPLPSPNLPPSGAAPWSRAPVSVQAQPGQPFPYAQPDNNPFYTPGGNGAPFPSNFNAAPALANDSDNPWSDNVPPVVPQTPYTAGDAYYSDNPWSDNVSQINLHPASMPDMPAFPGNQAYPQPSQPFPAPSVAPVTNGYIGLAQKQQPIPTTPPLLSSVQVGFTGQQPGTPASPAPPGYSSGDAGQPADAANSTARKRLRRGGLRTPGEHRALGEQISGSVSADMMVVSDPYLGTMPKQYNQKGQIVQQAPEEFDAR